MSINVAEEQGNPYAEQKASAPKRFLIVSDNVGTPFPPRGIFHYTSNLIRALRLCGHEVCLLVEQTQLYKVPHREHTRLKALSEVAGHSARLGAIYHYLWQTDYVGRYLVGPGLRRPLVRLLGLPSQTIPLMSLRGLRLLLCLPVTLRMEVISNDVHQVEFLPPSLDHLRALSELACCDSVYSISFASGFLGWGAATVDARGFDVILVDTPTYLRFEKSAGTETVAVIHDLIPLSDPTMGRRWRQTFANRLTQTIHSADSFIFVSDFIRRRFAELFPRAVAGRNTMILHPSVADDIADIAIVGAGDRHEYANSKGGEPAPEPGRGSLGGQSPRGYLVAIISDEPRKNIENLVSAFALLPQDIGLKVIGYADPNRYGLGKVNTPSGDGAAGTNDRFSRIEMLGYVSETMKKTVLAGALGVVVPSLTEGFGIPLVEGFFFGKPVFCSDIAVFREVAGENGIYFDPYSPKSIAGAIKAYLDNPAAFSFQIASGREQSRKRFSLSTLVSKVGQRFGNAKAVDRRHVHDDLGQ